MCRSDVDPLRFACDRYVYVRWLFQIGICHERLTRLCVAVMFFDSGAVESNASCACLQPFKAVSMWLLWLILTWA